MDRVVISFIVAAVGTGVLLPVLRRYFVDVPNERSSHAAPVPRGGGLGVIAAIAVGVSVTESWMIPQIAGLIWIALALLGFTGLLDDLYTLGAGWRLGIQVLAGGLVTASLSYTIGGGLVVHAVAAAFLVGLVNAFNFMDGINGISVVTVVVAGAWFAWVGRAADLTLLAPTMGLLMVGAAAGFACWNGAGKVFLGDVGSYFIGGLIAALILIEVAAGAPGLLMVAPLVLYVGDTVTTLSRRMVQGHRPGTAHRDHVYQRLTQDGCSHLTVAAIVGVFESLMCVAAWLLRDVPYAVPVAWAAILLIYAVLPTLIRHETVEAT